MKSRAHQPPPILSRSGACEIAVQDASVNSVRTRTAPATPTLQFDAEILRDPLLFEGI